MAFGTRRIIETPFCRWTLCDVGLIFFLVRRVTSISAQRLVSPEAYLLFYEMQ